MPPKRLAAKKQSAFERHREELRSSRMRPERRKAASGSALTVEDLLSQAEEFRERCAPERAIDSYIK